MISCFNIVWLLSELNMLKFLDIFFEPFVILKFKMSVIKSLLTSPGLVHQVTASAPMDLWLET